MLTPVTVVDKSLEDYRPIIGNKDTDEIYKRGWKILTGIPLKLKRKEDKNG